MNIDVSKSKAEDVAPLRELHRQEMNCQIVHDSFLRRGFTDPYLLHHEGRLAGYGLVANRYDPDMVDEFYLFPAYRGSAQALFRALLEASGAKTIRSQTNDRLLTLMLYDFGTKITTDTILFADAFTSHLECPGGVFCPNTDADRSTMFEHKGEPVGDWIIEVDGKAVGTGGYLTHYNPPYGDLYMEVDEPYRRRGFGSYLIQELKRVAYEAGKIPAARCSDTNSASRNTMQKAGLLPCGRILTGEVVK